MHQPVADILLTPLQINLLSEPARAPKPVSCKVYGASSANAKCRLTEVEPMSLSGGVNGLFSDGRDHNDLIGAAPCLDG